ncbi:hypothetical protein [Mesorhizobium sp. M0571]|uniref:hypothetical protein n=1 Tax=Mesorhizobium sp. M0571 TaxID=2956960 RepID=UPI003335478A
MAAKRDLHKNGLRPDGGQQNDGFVVAGATMLAFNKTSVAEANGDLAAKKATESDPLTESAPKPANEAVSEEQAGSTAQIERQDIGENEKPLVVASPRSKLLQPKKQFGRITDSSHRGECRSRRLLSHVELGLS